MTQTSARLGGHDYVIVGAGSAGAVLAARLSEDPGVRVLLLEAGPEAEADEISIPAAFPALFKTRWDWNYTTTEQKQLHNRRAYWPRMKALGGCSSMNAMIYIRGQRGRLRHLARRVRRHRLGLRRRAARTSSAPRATPGSVRRTTVTTDRCTSRTAATPTSSPTCGWRARSAPG